MPPPTPRGAPPKLARKPDAPPAEAPPNAPSAPPSDSAGAPAELSSSSTPAASLLLPPRATGASRWGGAVAVLLLAVLLAAPPALVPQRGVEADALLVRGVELASEGRYSESSEMLQRGIDAHDVLAASVAGGGWESWWWWWVSFGGRSVSSSRTAPTLPVALVTLGRALTQLGKPHLGTPHLERALAIAEDAERAAWQRSVAASASAAAAMGATPGPSPSPPPDTLAITPYLTALGHHSSDIGSSHMARSLLERAHVVYLRTEAARSASASARPSPPPGSEPQREDLFMLAAIASEAEDAARVRGALAGVYQSTGDPSLLRDAVKLAGSAYDFFHSKSPGSVNTGGAANTLAIALATISAPEALARADALIRSTLHDMKQSPSGQAPPASDPLRALTTARLTSTLCAITLKLPKGGGGGEDDALDVCRGALADAVATSGATSPVAGKVHAYLAVALFERTQYALAVEHSARATRILRGVFGPADKGTGNAAHTLRSSLTRLGQPAPEGCTLDVLLAHADKVGGGGAKEL